MAEIRPNGNDYTSNNLPYAIHPITPPNLSEIADVLQNGMQPLFHDVRVDIASCPDLTTAPYNLAGVGLGGNTSLVEFLRREVYTPWQHITRDIRKVFTGSIHDFFIIGSTFATKPTMPYYGHLIMNAMYTAPMGIRNESRLIFKESRNGQTRIEKLTDPNQMMYTYKGNFFISEGREGPVIRVRAKGRKKSDTDIITSMQTVLYENYRKKKNKLVALGGVLKMTNGRVGCNLIWDEYRDRILPFPDFVKAQQCTEICLESDMVAVGTIINHQPLQFNQEQRYGVNLYDRSEFHCFNNYGAGGQFITDTTPDTTEYEGYFNVAENIHLQVL
ncbi:PREDICTED: ester hydrolase C11orf54 homolog [Trachymyrmex cornetzi]|uniref:ester hydrolase C11orf54 homolog n=1 Tax=Trachymyrmex cornetzi TaxID=471704 RepID=UPI00084F0D1F|nr:PREDICTED: ester hydrolase C11orf54 homolog [Trachymyrmex cornetzi]XP_018371909.1 PREDICTED: ester hydrolase C11orf54 homolog [Trachymyrmex cornetzi]XP_018371919.1 PREDICTED: ester hydrolase C11orf54 homolog [Trachymyrmex cornetzi]XP_018371928.1 PREDICTED: ester hydrolase C11orf54 homolog [Trachymyrmex cornetzi]XP_018371932.1 PREDICTED: ester hydrolase C11orf54 homolog [Trachymyrmex cornetzi]